MLMSSHVRPPSVERYTPQWFCWYSRSGLAGGHHELVDALAGLRVRVRRVEVGTDAAVARLPGRAAVLGRERARPALIATHIRSASVGWGTIVWQISPPAPGCQPGPASGGRAGPSTWRPRRAAVVAPEQAGRLDAGVDRAVRRGHVPDRRDLRAVVAVGQALRRVRPGLAEVVAPEHGRPVPRRAAAGVDRAGRRVPLEVVDRPALAERLRDTDQIVAVARRRRG